MSTGVVIVVLVLTILGAFVILKIVTSKKTSSNVGPSSGPIPPRNPPPKDSQT